MIIPRFRLGFLVSASLLLSLILSGCASGGGSNSYSSGSTNTPPAAVVTITNQNPITTVGGGPAVTLNISVAHDQTSDVLTASVTSSTACGGPCGSFGTITGTPGSGSYTVQYTPPANVSSATSQTITVSSSLAGSTAGTTMVNLASSPAVVTISPNQFNAVPGSAAITLNISVTNDQPSDVLSASVTSSATCASPCGSVGPIQGTVGSGSYTVQYTPPASISQNNSQTITISSNLTGSTPGTTMVNLVSNSNAAVVAITNPNPPIKSVAGGAPVTLNISVTNDQASDVLTASVTSSAACASPCGSFGPIQGTAGSGSYTVQYTPPASISQNNFQTITISSNFAGSTPGTITVNLTSSGFLCPAQGNEQLMAGSWVFLVQGFNGANPMAIGAVFTVDGSGVITAGTMDINVAGSTPQTNLPVTSGSTYSVDKTGRACIGLAISAGTTKIFHAALSSYVNGVAAYEGQIEEFDDTVGTGGRAVGTLKRQNPSISSWSDSNLKSGFDFGLSGWDVAGGHVSAAGNITFDGLGGLTNGLGDVNDAGVLTTAQSIPTGTYTMAPNGRGTVSFAVGSMSVSDAIYAADSGDIFLLSTSRVNASAPLVAGRALAQIGSGSDIIGDQLVTLSGSNDATVGILSLSNIVKLTGNVSGTLWQDVGGTPSPQPIPISGTFTITNKTAGRVTFSAPGWTNPPVAYFTGFSLLAANGDKSLPTTAFLVGTGSNAEAGEIIWQTLAQPKFSAASLKYSAAYSDLQSSGHNSAFQATSAGQVTLDGMGGFTGSVGVSANSLSTNASVAGTYTVNPDGSGTFTPTGAANSPWPMVTNGLKSYHIIEPTGNTNPVVSIITKQ